MSAWLNRKIRGEEEKAGEWRGEKKKKKLF
jgi:hypothetical protein